MEIGLDFLKENFNYVPRKGIYESKKKTLGLSTGDDKNLMIDLSDRSTLIWWRENRGTEDIIFEGRKLKTEEEFKQVFDFLGLEIKNGRFVFQY